MADSKLTALSEISVPALEDLLYWVDDPAGTPISDKCSAKRAGGLFVPAVNEFRLSLVTGNATPTTDQADKGTLYWTPVLNDGAITSATGLVVLYDGTRPVLYSDTEKSLSLTLTSGSVYDIWVYDNSGTLALETLVWTNTTTRATALAAQNSFLAKNGALTRRYVGTLYATATNQTSDTAQKRCLWNMNNRRRRVLKSTDGTDSWTYNSSTYRPWPNNGSGAKIEMVRGLDEDPTYLAFLAISNCGGGQKAGSGIGLDSTSTDSSQLRGEHYDAGTGSNTEHLALYDGHPGIGYHYLQPLEASLVGTSTFIGDDGTTQVQAGCLGHVMA